MSSTWVDINSSRDTERVWAPRWSKDNQERDIANRSLLRVNVSLIFALSTFLSGRNVQTGPERVELATFVILRSANIAGGSRIETVNKRRCIAKRCLARRRVALRFLLASLA